MAFDICRLDRGWCEAAFGLATEMFVRYSPCIWQSEQNRLIAMPLMTSILTVIRWMVWHLLRLISDLRYLFQQHKQLFFVFYDGASLEGKGLAKDS